MNSSQAQTNPIGLPAAWRTRRQGEGAQGGYVWFGVWFPLLCLANSLERRKLTAPGTGTLVRQGEREKGFMFLFLFFSFFPLGLDPLGTSHLALQTAKRQRVGTLLVGFLSQPPRF